NEKAGGQTGGKEESGQEEGREKGGQEVGRQTQTRRQAARQKEKGDREEIGGKEKRGQEKEARKEEKKQSLTLRYCCVGAASLTRRLDEGRSDLDLGAEFHHLPGRHAEERGGAFGVALQEGEHGFPPDPHARNVLARDDGLAADVIGDVVEVEPGQLALPAGQDQALIDRRVLH